MVLPLGKGNVSRKAAWRRQHLLPAGRRSWGRRSPEYSPGGKGQEALGQGTVRFSKETLQCSREASGFLSCCAFLRLELDKTFESSYLHLNAGGKSSRAFR